MGMAWVRVVGTRGDRANEGCHLLATKVLFQGPLVP